MRELQSEAIHVELLGQSAQRLRFGDFEVDLQSGELRKRAMKRRLSEQPFQVLAILLERPGEVVRCEALQARLLLIAVFRLWSTSTTLCGQRSGRSNWYSHAWGASRPDSGHTARPPGCRQCAR
jgi:hypothetical protein